ncbi:MULTISPECIES: hypothetical protein [Lactobacillales]|uniref:hypothetical protein n=1 Tax=Lactobacillales TaxID=186826 RepID=UPI00050E8163|nr:MULTISPECIES: hypothetical protein [Lactobacillales]KGH59589.1 hypothetical protein X288_04200 [Oenococcus oeni IOEB_9805]KGH74827.1 hypothetical protein X285_09530 [Oenococcus oeni IOEB_9304]KGH75922.1 hypothetical protein X287_04235 [Oenococcus oeni IOEB_9803]KGH78076.1 hypothetical protein X284_05450 [Oenococcus oeni IOEB_8417]KGH84427.1 hypothetical protein X292_09070 [Oenococcus oeni IOEB_C28]
MKLTNTIKLLNRFHKESSSKVNLSKKEIVNHQYVKKIEMFIEVIKNKIYIVPINTIYAYKPVRIEVRNTNNCNDRA